MGDLDSMLSQHTASELASDSRCGWLQGISALPRHCIQMCVGFFLAAVMISILRDLLPKKYAAFVPIPMAAAIPFYIGAQLAVSHLHRPFGHTSCHMAWLLLPY